MANRYWVGGSGNINDTAHWSTTSGGSGGASAPIGSDNAIFDANSFATTGQTVTATEYFECFNFVWTGATNSPSFVLNASTGMVVYGDFTLISGMTATFNDWVYFYPAGSQTLTTAGKTLYSISIEDAGTLTLQDNLVCGDIAHNKGTFDTNGKSVSCGTFDCTATNTRTLTLGASTITLSVDWLVDATGLTLNANTSSIVLVSNGVQFLGGSKTYNNLEIQGTNSVIKGSNTFSDLKLTANKTTKFTANTTQTIATMSGAGTAGNLITIESSSAGTAFSLSKSSGSITVEYYSIKDSTSTGGATFTAVDSTPVGGNTGWLFSTRKTLTTNTTATATTAKLSGKVLSALSTVSSGVARATNKTLAAGINVISGVVKSVGKTLATAITATASISKSISKSITALTSASSTNLGIWDLGINKNTRAMWVWAMEDLSLITNPTELFAFCTLHNINVILLGATADYLYDTGNHTALSVFITTAHENNIRVEALDGSKYWALTANHYLAVDHVDATWYYNVRAGANGKFDGVHHDVEPYLLDNWEEDTLAIEVMYLDMITSVKAETTSASLTYGVDIPMWYNNSWSNVLYNGNVKMFHEHIIDIMDWVGIMDYTSLFDPETGQTLMIPGGYDEVNYAQTAGKKVCLGAETIGVQWAGDQNATFNGIGSYYLDLALSQVYTYFEANTGFGGIAIHHYASYLELATFYKTLSTTATAAANKTIDASKAVTTNTSAMVTTTKSTAKTLSATITALTNRTIDTSKTLATAITAVSNFVRASGKVINTSVVVTPSVTKGVNKLLTSTVSAMVTIPKFVQKVLTSAITATASILKITGKTLEVTISTSANRTIDTSKSVSTSISADVLLSKLTEKGISAFVSCLANFITLTGTIYYKTLQTNVVASTSMIKDVLKSITTSTTASASDKKDTAKNVESITTTSVSNTKDITKTATSSTATSANITKNTAKTIISITTVASSITKMMSKTLNTFATIVSSATKLTYKAISATVSAGATFLAELIVAGGTVFYKTLTTATTASSSVSKMTSKTLNTLTSISSSFLNTITRLFYQCYASFVERTPTISIGVDQMAIAGNTVRFTAEFKTFADIYADPSSITFKVYNKTGGQIGSTVNITAANKTATGIYKYNYVIPVGYTSIMAEFIGILEGSPLRGVLDIDIT